MSHPVSGDLKPKYCSRLEHHIPPTLPDPLRILESLCDSVWFSDSWNYGGEAIFQVGFDDGIFRADFHGMIV